MMKNLYILTIEAQEHEPITTIWASEEEALDEVRKYVEDVHQFYKEDVFQSVPSVDEYFYDIAVKSSYSIQEAWNPYADRLQQQHDRIEDLEMQVQQQREQIEELQMQRDLGRKEPLKKTWTVHVTEQHITKAIDHSCALDAIEAAIKEKGTASRVAVLSDHIIVFTKAEDKNRLLMYKHNVPRIVNMLTEGTRVKPFTMELEFIKMY